MIKRIAVLPIRTKARNIRPNILGCYISHDNTLIQGLQYGESEWPSHSARMEFGVTQEMFEKEWNKCVQEERNKP